MFAYFCTSHSHFRWLISCWFWFSFSGLNAFLFHALWTIHLNGYFQLVFNEITGILLKLYRVQFIVQSTCITNWFSLIVSPPQCRTTCFTICTNNTSPSVASSLQQEIRQKLTSSTIWLRSIRNTQAYSLAGASDRLSAYKITQQVFNERLFPWKVLASGEALLISVDIAFVGWESRGGGEVWYAIYFWYSRKVWLLVYFLLDQMLESEM